MSETSMPDAPAKPECKRTGSSFPAWVSGQGEGFLMGAVYTTHPCGCRVVGNATLPHPLTIQFCELHKGAQATISNQAASMKLQDEMINGARKAASKLMIMNSMLKDALSAIVKKCYLREGRHEDCHVHPALIQTAREVLAKQPESYEPFQVKIEVRGGCAEVTSCPAGVEVEIIDHDNH